MYTYFIQPKRGSKEINEEDLDEPSTVELEQALSKTVPGLRAFPTASKKSNGTASDGTVCSTRPCFVLTTDTLLTASDFRCIFHR